MRDDDEHLESNSYNHVSPISVLDSILLFTVKLLEVCQIRRFSN